MTKIRCLAITHSLKSDQTCSAYQYKLIQADKHGDEEVMMWAWLAPSEPWNLTVIELPINSFIHPHFLESDMSHGNEQ